MQKIKLPSDTTKLVHEFYKIKKVSGDQPYKITRRVEGYNGTYRRAQGCYGLETSFFKKNLDITLHFTVIFLRKSYSYQDLNWKCMSYSCKRFKKIPVNSNIKKTPVSHSLYNVK